MAKRFRKRLWSCKNGIHCQQKCLWTQDGWQKESHKSSLASKEASPELPASPPSSFTAAGEPAGGLSARCSLQGGFGVLGAVDSLWVGGLGEELNLALFCVTTGEFALAMSSPNSGILNGFQFQKPCRLDKMWRGHANTWGYMGYMGPFLQQLFHPKRSPVFETSPYDACMTMLEVNQQWYLTTLKD